MIREERGRPRLHTEPCPKAAEATRRVNAARSGVATPGGPLPRQTIAEYGLTVWVGREPSSNALQGLVAAWVDAGYRGLYILCPRTFGPFYEWGDMAQDMAQADLLVFDKWDRFRPPPRQVWKVESLCRILTNRTKARLPSVVKLTAPLRVVMAEAERQLFRGFIIG